MTEIKFCPFCGFKPGLGGGGDCHYVQCFHCDAEGPPREDQEQAIAAWNCRPGEDRAREQERERCAGIAETFIEQDNPHAGEQIAEDVRSGSIVDD